MLDDRHRCHDRMVAYMDFPKKLGARADRYSAAKRGDSAVTEAESHLLKDDAIGSDHRIGVDHDAVGLRDHQPSADDGVDRDVGPGHRGPKTMAKHRPFADQRGDRAARLVALITTDGCH